MYRVYERSLEVPIRISKTADEQSRLRRLERWPRESGLSLVLDESGSNFNKLVQMYASDYGLELGEKKWGADSSGEEVKATLEIPLLKAGQQKGRAVMNASIPKKPSGEEGNNYVYTASLNYFIELEDDVLSEGAERGLVEFTL
ncbi:MAG: hypothetical protein TU35_005190 [Thermoproteus sp. AZ2]|jgi:hypothetical protein|uniref:Uncharacterized protein n=1 Tax=Thermoproteus sp. AZ2 TaxID=1609232 RepID=A0ACC6V1X0_9CREN|nr:MAG: hypothetical protein TU35_06270 [Thermoproteus sp. AZ2]